jgi:CheY-specific phosphatase CheX
MNSLHLALRELLAGKATELFTDYSVAWAHSTDDQSSERQLCGILGFTGDKMCGSVVISATETAVACSNPIGDGATRAWVAELTNQLVGRFKNSLFRGGIEVAMSIPVVLTATSLQPLPQAQAEPIRLKVGDGSMTIWLEIESEPGLELQEPSEDSQIAPEGDLMMF